MPTLDLDTWEWEEDHLATEDELEDLDDQELLHVLDCPRCTGDMTPFFWKEYGICGHCINEELIKEKHEKHI